jgi:hypothetical protein
MFYKKSLVTGNMHGESPFKVRNTSQGFKTIKQFQAYELKLFNDQFATDMPKSDNIRTRFRQLERTRARW